MSGALCWYITHAAPADFQPMKANFGILPPIENGVGRMNKRQRAAYRSQRALKDLDAMLEIHNWRKEPDLT
jgi:methylenetetrahydrofolate--tRNA-(uracil-5-)-methyltransferase